MSEERHGELVDLLANEDFKKWVLKPTYERQIFWEKWLENNPDKKDTFNTAAEIIRSANFGKLRIPAEEKDQILSNIINNSQLASPTRSTYSIKATNRKKLSIKHFVFKAAAVLVFIALFAGLLHWNLEDKGSYTGSTKLAQVQRENPRGRKSVVTLPDGSRVTLNSSSKIIYDANYGLTDRLVRIEGEAFFEVQKDSLKPFRVMSGDVITTALGTSFNVRAFSNEKTQTISLRTGSIKVATNYEPAAQQEYLLKPGEGFIIDKNSGEIEKIAVDPIKVYSWKDGILVFKDDGLEEVIQTLERWYDVKFTVIGQPVKSWRADGKYDNESLENVLQGLSYTYDLEFLIKGKNVELKFN